MALRHWFFRARRWPTSRAMSSSLQILSAAPMCSGIAPGTPDAILIATGSEVQLAVAAAQQLASSGKQVRVVSMPCAELFEQQDAAYREAVLPSDVLARVAVEALHADYWYKWVGLDGRVVGMTTFGESAPAEELMQHFGFTTENVVAVVEDALP